MAALAHPPPRTPSPKIKIHRSQSFDSPSSRISVTPIEESPYSKSTSFIGAISNPLPRYDALKAAERAMLRHGGPLHTKISDDSMMSDVSSSSDSDISDSPTSESQFRLFPSGSPSPTSPSNTNSHPYPYTFVHPPAPTPPQVLSSSFQIYQDPSTPMYDPWLVRVVLDLFDVRGFDWMSIAEPIERVWGVKTGSAEVLEILVGNGRVCGRVWWD